MSKPLNIGMIGYGFMGRTHSNAYRQVSKFFHCEHRPVLKACCARKQGEDQSVRRELGLRVVRDRLAEADRAEGYRRDRHRLAQQHAQGDRAGRGRGRQDDPLREAAGDERGRRRGDGARRSRRPACPTWCGSTIAACRPSRWPSRWSTKAASAGRSTIAPRTCRTGRSPPTCRRAAPRCGGSTSTWPARA